MSRFDDVEPEHLRDAIVERTSAVGAEVYAYWIRVNGDRELYAARLRELLRGLPYVVHVVRDDGFSNPNSIAADVARVLDVNREACQSAVTGQSSGPLLGVVLVGRGGLALTQASSPVSLPQWFPVRGGETVNIMVEDVTWTVDVPLNCGDANIGDMCEALYRLEGALIARLMEVQSIDHNAGNALMDIIREPGDGSYGELLQSFRYSHSQIPVASGFRPSLREGTSLIARIWRTVQTRTPEDLHKPSKSLVRALELEDQADFESMAGVLSRPSSRDATSARYVCRNMLSAVGWACQFITAAAHAGEYRRYPMPLLRSLSFELRRSLVDLEQILRSISPAGSRVE